MSDRLYIGLGSNVGARMQNLSLARKMVSERGLLNEMVVSPVYGSPALLPKDAPREWDMPFVNQVVSGITELSPQEVLLGLQAIEREIGKRRRGHWAPREIDLDILAFGNRQMSNETLQIPHPQMTMRDFVLLPLRDIAPDWVHPVSGKNIALLVDELPVVTAKPIDDTDKATG